MMNIEELERSQEELLQKMKQQETALQDAGQSDKSVEKKEMIYTAAALLAVFLLGAASIYWGLGAYFYLLMGAVATFGILRLFNVLISLGKALRELTAIAQKDYRSSAIQHREVISMMKEQKDLTYLLAAYLKAKSSKR